jgi:hypothetical protein
MKKLDIDYDDIQKAMEDTEREAFEYFIDIETGDVIILSQEIINRAWNCLRDSVDEDMADYEEVEFDEIMDMPDWMEDEIELALDIFIHERERYIRIPERSPRDGYSSMIEFTNGLENADLREELRGILTGKGVFRRFKDALESQPKERKLWYGFNAKAAKKEIEAWLKSLGIVKNGDQ